MVETYSDGTTNVHECGKVDVLALFLCIQNDLLFVLILSNCQDGSISSFFHSLSSAVFASGIFIAWSIGINVCTKLHCNTEFWSFPCNVVFVNSFVTDSILCLVDSCAMVSLTKLTVHFATPQQISRSANPSHLKTEKLENNLRLFFIVPALDVRSQVPSIKDRRNGVGKPALQVFALTAPDLCVPDIHEVLQHVISQASTANV